jgi:hypothetical protein
MSRNKMPRRIVRFVLAPMLALGLTAVAVVTPASAAFRGDAAPAGPVRVAEQNVFLGTEYDKCSGSLQVWDRFNNLVPISRGKWTTVDVAIDGGGYWWWRCGNSDERSRGKPDYRQRVKRLSILHSTKNRDITWNCFDVLP